MQVTCAHIKNVQEGKEHTREQQLNFLKHFIEVKLALFLARI